jgi:hypothetical protein
LSASATDFGDVRAARDLTLALLGVGRVAGAERLRAAGACRVLEDFSDYGRLLRFLDDAEVPAAATP